jgi:hypothetical protein
MATIAIPIVTTALGSLGPLIANLAMPLIQLAEAHFAPKTGSSKMETVLQTLQAFLTPLASSGTIQQPVPAQTELQSIVEGVLAVLKTIPGALPAPGSGATVTPTTAPGATSSISPAALNLTIGLLTTLKNQS